MASPKSTTRTIYLDQSSAQAALTKLEEKLKKLQAELKTGTLEGDKLNKKIAEIENTRKNIAFVELQLKNGLTPTLAQVKQQVTQLQNELSRMSNNAPGYAEKFEAFKAAQAQLQGMQDKFKAVEQAQRTWMDEVKLVAWGTLIGQVMENILSAIGSYFTGLVSGNARLSDSFADIQKATGLSQEQVIKLNSELSKIDTRTATSDLRDIAISLGQLGQEADAGAIEAIDKIVVALGDEFGGDAQSITKALSVLRNNLIDFRTGNYGQDIEHIGNALNVLGAEGLATAPVVTEIANRIAGVAQSFKVSSGQIFGIAATFQELGIETERGSTSIIKLFQKISAEPEKFATITGLSAAKFKEVVNTDMVKAFELVAEGAKTAGSSNTAFGKILKDLDADGSGVGEVLSKLGQNSELLTEKINLASDSLKSNNSILNEFSIKNNTAGAELDKLSKAWNSLTSSQTATQALGSIVKMLTSFINALKATPKYIQDNKTALYLLLAGIALLNKQYIISAALIIRDTAVRIANTIATRAGAIATNVSVASQSAYIVVTNLLTGRIALATAAQRLWNIAMSIGAGPLGVLLIAAGALIMKLGSLLGVTKELTAAQQVHADIEKEIATSTSEQSERIKGLLAIAQDLTNDYEVRQKAIAALHKESNGYLEAITLENATTQASIQLANDYITALQNLAGAKALASLKQKLSTEILEQNFDLKTKEKAAKEESGISDFFLSPFGASDNSKYTAALETNVQTTEKYNFVVQEISTNITKLNGDIAAQEAELSKLTKGTAEYTTAANKLANLKQQRNILQGFSDNTTPVTAAATTTTTVTTTTEEAAAKKAQEEAKKLREEFLKLRADIQDSINKLSQSSFSYELSKIFEKKLEDEKKVFEPFKKGIISATEKDSALENIRKNAELQVIKLNIDLQKNFKEKPVEVPVIPEVAEEDVRALQLAVKRALSNIAIPQSEEVAKRSIALLEGTDKEKHSAKIANIDDQEEDELREKQREAELNGTNLLESEKEAIRAKYRGMRAEADAEFANANTESIKALIGYADQGLQILSKFNDAKRERENRELQKSLEGIESQKTKFKNMLDSRLITQSQYNAAISRLEKEANDKSEAVKKKQFQRDKKFQLAQAAVSGATAIINAYNTKPWLPAGLINGILASALVAAQLVTIATAKYAKGGVLTGNSHSQGGMPVINTKTGRVEAEVEGGEVILSKKTVSNNWDYIEPLLHTSMKKDGERIQPWWNDRQYKAVNYTHISDTFQKKTFFASGGVFKPQQQTQRQDQPTTVTNDPETKMLMQAILSRLNNPVAPVIKNVNVPLTKIEEAQQLKNRIDSESTFR